MAHKTWGGRFKKELHPLVKTFNASLPFDYVLYKHDILGSQTHAKMLAKQELISDEEASKIIDALKLIESELDNNQHSLDETYEDIHMFIEHLLVEKIGDVGKKLHTGRSRNEQVALDLRLYIREAGKQIEKGLIDLVETLNQLSTKHHADMMPGYTHLQQAQPVSLGRYFGAYSSMFSRDITRLTDWKKRMSFSPMGAGAFAGSNLPLDRAYIANELEFDGFIENTIDAVSDRDYLIEFCSAASIIMMHLSRLSEDIIVWSTQEFNFITLDDSFATGSSLMPNKKNPDVPELIRGKTGRVFGHLMGILTVMKGLPLAYNKDMQEDKEGLFDTVNTLTACLNVITPFMESISFNTAHMSEASESGYLNATVLLESLVLKGMPFRDAHHQVGEWVSEAMENNMSLNALLKSK